MDPDLIPSRLPESTKTNGCERCVAEFGCKRLSDRWNSASTPSQLVVITSDRFTETNGFEARVAMFRTPVSSHDETLHRKYNIRHETINTVVVQWLASAGLTSVRVCSNLSHAFCNCHRDRLHFRVAHCSHRALETLQSVMTLAEYSFQRFDDVLHRSMLPGLSLTVITSVKT